MLIHGRSGSVSLRPQKSRFLWDGYTLRSPTLHLSTLTCNLWIPLFPTAEEDLQWWTSAHNVLRVAPVTPTEQGCFEHRLGTTLECIDGVQCMDNNRENTSHQHARFGSHTQSHAPLAVEAYGPDSPGCVSGTWAIQLYRRTKRLLLMCQDNQIVLRARHIPRKLNVLADILSRPAQMSGTEWSLHLICLQQGGITTSTICVPHSMGVDALSMSWKALWAYHESAV